MKTWRCVPPPGSGLPEFVISGPTAVNARIRVGRWLREYAPDMGHSAPNYWIREVITFGE